MLTILLGEVVRSTDIEPGNGTTAVEGALNDLLNALAAHEVALAGLDRREDEVVAAHGYPRVPLPADSARPGLAYAADPTTIVVCAGIDLAEALNTRHASDFN